MSVLNLDQQKLPGGFVTDLQKCHTSKTKLEGQLTENENVKKVSI